MKLWVSLISLLALTICGVGSATAALRVPQVPVSGAGLQYLLNSYDGGIRALGEQDARQTWSKPVFGFPPPPFFIELIEPPAAGTLGLYDAALATAVLYPLFPAEATAHWFAVVSFRSGPPRLLISTFTDGAEFVKTTVYSGVNATELGISLVGASGTFYTQDARNPGQAAQALSFAGTGANAGYWLLTFEDTAISGGAPPSQPSDQDYDDCLLFLDVGTAVPVARTSWGALKQRFR